VTAAVRDLGVVDAVAAAQVGDEQLPTTLVAVHHEDRPPPDPVIHRPSVGPTPTGAIHVSASTRWRDRSGGTVAASRLPSRSWSSASSMF
jgi:hypothetical protein